jgi:hypothetical protein
MPGKHCPGRGVLQQANRLFTLRYTLDLCPAALLPMQPVLLKPAIRSLLWPSSQPEKAFPPSVFARSVATKQSRGPMRLPRFARNNRKRKVARRYNITVPPPLWAEVRGKFNADPNCRHCTARRCCVPRRAQCRRT